MDINAILTQYRELCEDNDWNAYHTPKNLASAVTVSSAKLLERFQWLTEEDSLTLSLIPSRKEDVSQGIAEVFFQLLALSDKCGISLQEAIEAKAAKDAEQHQGIPDEVYDEMMDE